SVFDHRHVITKLGGIANGHFDARMRYQSDDDELVDAMLLELKIQIRIGEAAGAPMFAGDDLARLGDKLGAKFATPCAVFEAPVLPRGPLYRGNVLPGFVIARTISMMHRVEDP